MKEKKCCSCRNGEIDAPADFLVKGRVRSNADWNFRPFRGWVCVEHLEMMGDDGCELSIIDRTPDQWVKWADEVTRNNTIFRSFAEMCDQMAHPTLRGFVGALKLRQMFLATTGRKAGK